jgi:hypothetical protein
MLEAKLATVPWCGWKEVWEKDPLDARSYSARFRLSYREKKRVESPDADGDANSMDLSPS